MEFNIEESCLIASMAGGRRKISRTALIRRLLRFVTACQEDSDTAYTAKKAAEKLGMMSDIEYAGYDFSEEVA